MDGLLFLLVVSVSASLFGQHHDLVSRPTMGWSSWYAFKTAIDEDIIKRQADFLASTGLQVAGYSYVNVDDGFLAGRDSKGELLSNAKKFPNGMKSVADYIHAKGLKAGIYSDAGICTCASISDGEILASDSGLFGHEEKDLDLMLNTWAYDYIKIDWCGGLKMALDDQSRYTYIGEIIRRIKPSVVYNVCRWKFTGEWMSRVANSWRISGDLEDKFEAILRIIDTNANLWKYCLPGHYNDMDMLQVGRGMSYEEDKAHFSMWCMLKSPLFVSVDLAKISQQSLTILTNKELIAINQDELAYQARRIEDFGDTEVWAAPLVHVMSGKMAVALLNRSNKEASIAVDYEKLGLKVEKGYTTKDLWIGKEYTVSTKRKQIFSVSPHGIVVLKIVGKMMPHNIFQEDVTE